MELTETYTLPVSQLQTWQALNDTEILRALIPGCESIEPDGVNVYTVVLMAAVGPVKARFKGRMELTDVDVPHAYTIVFEGQGGVAGFGKGQTHVKLEPAGDDETRLTYTAHAQVGGKLAQIGSRLVDAAARKLATEFFKRLSDHLTGTRDVALNADDSTGVARAKADDDGVGDDGSDKPQRKRSWTAWISKS